MKIVVLTAALIMSCASLAAQDTEVARADKLFAARDNIENLKQAAAILETARSRDAANYEVLWRLAKFKYYLGDREKNEAAKIRLLEAGIEAAKRAVAANDKRVEGHFWLGANDGEYADLKGVFTSLGLVKSIRKEFEAAREIDPAYENGSVYVALGEMDLSLPRLMGGSDRRGLETLEKGLAAAPSNVELRVTLGGRYVKKGRNSDARRLLEDALTLIDPLRTPAELDELRAKARAMLDKLK